jgi:hypothetical protein
MKHLLRTAAFLVLSTLSFNVIADDDTIDNCINKMSHLKKSYLANCDIFHGADAKIKKLILTNTSPKMIEKNCQIKNKGSLDRIQARVKTKLNNHFSKYISDGMLTCKEFLERELPQDKLQAKAESCDADLFLGNIITPVAYNCDIYSNPEAPFKFTSIILTENHIKGLCKINQSEAREIYLEIINEQKEAHTKLVNRDIKTCLQFITFMKSL